MAKKLVVVESPSKAKTIGKYLGPDYRVMASIGHIKDLPSKGLGVDVQNNFEPTYEVIPEAKKPHFRVMFNEITKRAVQEAFKEPKTIDQHLVDAQQARRVLDRLVGYKVSPLLCRTIGGGASAGGGPAGGPR